MTNLQHSDWRASGRPLRGIVGVLVAGAALAVHVLSFRWLRAPGWKNKAEAQRELRRLVSEHDGLSHNSWAERIGLVKRIEFTTPAGTWYQSRVEPFWDDRPGGAIRVLITIDDGGVGAYHPLTESILVGPPET